MASSTSATSFSVAAASCDAWKKSLRSYGPGPGDKARRSDVHNHHHHHNANAGGKANKIRKLSVIDEEGVATKKPRRASLGIEVVATASKKPAAKAAQDKVADEPAKKAKRIRNMGAAAAAKPASLSIPKVAASREKIVSPVPLPLGVVCIDPPSWEQPLLAYTADFITYLKGRENCWIRSAADILGRRHDLEGNRAMLMDWVLEVCNHFAVSQETLYHTVGLVDATLAIRDVETDHLQLVALASLLIAAKLEEYYPPGLRDMTELVEQSYTTADIVAMERRLLVLHNFAAFDADHAIFIKRFIRAALKDDGDGVFINACFLFVDCLIPTIGFSSTKVSLKSAAAVYAARAVLDVADKGRWTPTLAYYTGYEEADVAPVGRKMVSTFLDGLHSGKEDGVMRKYRSKSKHCAITKDRRFQLEHMEAVAASLGIIG